MTKTSFSELLQKKAESYGAEARKNKALIDDWVEAIAKLFAQIREWLAVSDPTKILYLEDRKTEVNEPNVGRYQAPRLDIRAFDKWVGIIPKARKTIKTARPPQAGAPERATGRVDMTDEILRYVLYRYPVDGKDTWFIEGPASDLQPLTKEQFEEALASYFQ